MTSSVQDKVCTIGLSFESYLKSVSFSVFLILTTLCVCVCVWFFFLLFSSPTFKELCEDKEENCPIRAASGDCWKTAQPSDTFYVGKRFPLWDICPKSCRRCHGEQIAFN